MKKFFRSAILFSWLLLPALDVSGQCTETVAPTTDAMGNITASGTYSISATDPATQRIIDARPNAVVSGTGKIRFGNRGTVVITNMNPFLFDGYRINIKEEEIQSQALIKFAKALIPIAGDFIETQKQESAFDRAENQNSNLDVLINRLQLPPTAVAGPPPPAAFLAMQHMITLKTQLVNDERALRNYFSDVPGALHATSYLVTTSFSATKQRFIKHGGFIFDRDTDLVGLCDNVNALLLRLTPANAYPSQNDLQRQRQNIENMVSKANALKQAVGLYNKQDLIKNTKWIGSTGFNYVEDLELFADQLIGGTNTRYTTKATRLFEQVVEFDNMKVAIQNLRGREDTLLQQDFPIGGKYDFSKVTVTVQPFGEKTPRNRQETVRNGDRPVGNDPAASGQNGGGPSSPPNTGSGPNASESASAGNQFAEAGGNKPDPAATPNPADAPAKITDVVTTGKPRFEIGVGMAYSQVEKRRFQVVSGFARDRDGNLTNGETFTNIVGFSEQTDHRLTPVALLHTRLTNNPKHNLYFSLGITGSRDQLGTNIEYLIGPSVNVTDNIFITVGAFAGRQHDLAGEDLFVGAGVPSGFDAIPVRSRYQWKPGFSFSYRLPVFGTSKTSAAPGNAAAGNANALGTYTETLYAGEPRFTISAGMAYSPLRQQNFQPIIGFARNREGVLTNGETFTRVVGFSENSDGRYLPMALLNTRILNNEQIGLHFSLGITAKRTDANTDVEYLVGPSFSFLQNQIIFTAGAYAGKQQKIAGDLFVNAALSGTTLKTQKEYHFKPGIAFSYRLPVKLP